MLPINNDYEIMMVFLCIHITRNINTQRRIKSIPFPRAEKKTI